MHSTFSAWAFVALVAALAALILFVRASFRRLPIEAQRELHVRVHGEYVQQARRRTPKEGDVG